MSLLLYLLLWSSLKPGTAGPQSMNATTVTIWNGTTSLKFEGLQGRTGSLPLMSGFNFGEVSIFFINDWTLNVSALITSGYLMWRVYMTNVTNPPPYQLVECLASTPYPPPYRIRSGNQPFTALPNITGIQYYLEVGWRANFSDGEWFTDYNYAGVFLPRLDWWLVAPSVQDKGDGIIIVTVAVNAACQGYVFGQDASLPNPSLNQILNGVNAYGNTTGVIGNSPVNLDQGVTMNLQFLATTQPNFMYNIFLHVQNAGEQLPLLTLPIRTKQFCYSMVLPQGGIDSSGNCTKNVANGTYCNFSCANGYSHVGSPTLCLLSNWTDTGVPQDCVSAGPSLCPACNSTTNVCSLTPYPQACLCLPGYMPNSSQNTCDGCTTNYYSDGTFCHPCATDASSPPLSQTCNCNPEFRGDGTVVCFAVTAVFTGPNTVLQVQIRLLNASQASTQQFQDQFQADVASSLNISITQVSIVSVVPNPSIGPNAVTVTFNIKAENSDSLLNLATNLKTQITDPNSKLHQSNTTSSVDSKFYNFSILNLVLGGFATLPPYLIVVIVFSILFFILFLYFVDRKFFPRAQNLVLLSLLFSLLSKVGTIYFFIFLDAIAIASLEWERILALVALLLPSALNLLASTGIIRNELRYNDLFRQFFQEHYIASAIAWVLSAFNTNNARLMSSGVFGLGSLSARLSNPTEAKLIAYGLITNLLGDVPSIVAQVSVSYSLGTFQTAAAIAFAFNVINLLHGLILRSIACLRASTPETRQRYGKHQSLSDGHDGPGGIDLDSVEKNYIPSSPSITSSEESSLNR